MSATTTTTLIGQASDEPVSNSASTKSTTKRFPHGICWGTATWIGVLHLGALAAPFTFSWEGLYAMLVLYWLTAGIGICLGYHRLLSHRSFVTFKPLRWLIAFVGGLAGQGSAIHWSANHRMHHAFSDQEKDPHSPNEGFWWSHMIWCLGRIPAQEKEEVHKKWAPDLYNDPVMRFLESTFLVWYFVLGAALYGTGWYLEGHTLGLSMLVWGLFLRLVIVLHCTWCINSVTHVFGYKTYKTKDDSRNLWWVALVTFGEGWHNNHHAFPRAASYQHKWWEFDITAFTIKLMRLFGLAWEVAKLPNQRMKDRLS